MLKFILGIVEKPKKEPNIVFKVLDKAQYAMYVAIVIHMVMKLINSMKKTFGTSKGNDKELARDMSIGIIRGRASR